MQNTLALSGNCWYEEVCAVRVPLVPKGRVQQHQPLHSAGTRAAVLVERGRWCRLDRSSRHDSRHGLRAWSLVLATLLALFLVAGVAAATYVETRVTGDPNEQVSPALDGDKAVYEDNRNGNADIYAYDLSTSSETRLTYNTSDQSIPKISGDKVVYEDYRNGNADIYAYDLSTGTGSRLTTAGSNQTLPSVSGSQVVYEDDRNGNSDIYSYDMAANIEMRVTSDPGEQVYPAISGIRVVFEDSRNTQADIYLVEGSGTPVGVGTNGIAIAGLLMSGVALIFMIGRRARQSFAI